MKNYFLKQKHTFDDKEIKIALEKRPRRAAHTKQQSSADGLISAVE